VSLCCATLSFPLQVKPYLYYVFLFVLGVWANMQSLSASNVDTVVVFRACTPLAVAVLDSIFLGRELPGRRSAGALALLGLGALGYVQSDAQFALAGFAAYYWVSLYFVIICIEMTYGKKIVSSVKMATVSGSVLYTNFFAVLPMLAISASRGEAQKFGDTVWTAPAVFYLALSCIVGTAISYCGWWCRGQISATSFTLVGVVNKVLTVLLNVFVWDKHASAIGIAFLMLCLVGGGLYKQAPMRGGGDGALPSYQQVPQSEKATTATRAGS
jgi:GDP-mannose transporter